MTMYFKKTGHKNISFNLYKFISDIAEVIIRNMEAVRKKVGLLNSLFAETI